jgi:hypothetical protein
VKSKSIPTKQNIKPNNEILNDVLTITDKSSLVADKIKTNIDNNNKYKAGFIDITINKSLKSRFKKLDSEIEREIKSRKKLIGILKRGEYMHEYLAEEEKLKDFQNTVRIIKNVLVYDKYEIKKNITIFNSIE